MGTTHPERFWSTIRKKHTKNRSQGRLGIKQKVQYCFGPKVDVSCALDSNVLWVSSNQTLPIIDLGRIWWFSWTCFLWMASSFPVRFLRIIRKLFMIHYISEIHSTCSDSRVFTQKDSYRSINRSIYHQLASIHQIYNVYNLGGQGQTSHYNQDKKTKKNPFLTLYVVFRLLFYNFTKDVISVIKSVGRKAASESQKGRFWETAASVY